MILTTQKASQETTQKVLQILGSNPKATRKELAEKTGLTPDGIKWNLNKLKKEGIFSPSAANVWYIFSRIVRFTIQSFINSLDIF